MAATTICELSKLFPTLPQDIVRQPLSVLTRIKSPVNVRFMAGFKTHKEIIVALGGATAVARELGLGPTAVQNMCDRNRIASGHWAEFIALAERNGVRGVTTEVLLNTARKDGRHSKKKEPMNEVAA